VEYDLRNKVQEHNSSSKFVDTHWILDGDHGWCSSLQDTRKSQTAPDVHCWISTVAVAWMEIRRYVLYTWEHVHSQQTSSSKPCIHVLVFKSDSVRNINAWLTPRLKTNYCPRNYLEMNLEAGSLITSMTKLKVINVEWEQRNLFSCKEIYFTSTFAWIPNFLGFRQPHDKDERFEHLQLWAINSLLLMAKCTAVPSMELGLHSIRSVLNCFASSAMLQTHAALRSDSWHPRRWN
jgi:hypothetical protein